MWNGLKYVVELFMMRWCSWILKSFPTQRTSFDDRKMMRNLGRHPLFIESKHNLSNYYKLHIIIIKWPAIFQQLHEILHTSITRKVLKFLGTHPLIYSIRAYNDPEIMMPIPLSYFHCDNGADYTLDAWKVSRLTVLRTYNLHISGNCEHPLWIKEYRYLLLAAPRHVSFRT